MILVGAQRSGAAALADHLTNRRDNDHVEVVELTGFMAGDLHGALQEVQAIATATRCRQYLFSLSLNPPPRHVATEEQFRAAADRAETALGLAGQPRALVIHEKEGRRHAHVVWSRIDPETVTAINLPHFKTRLRNLARELFLDNGWDLPEGLARHGGKNPLNFTFAEWQQARRQDADPREIKQLFRQAWERSDGLAGLKNALEERGYYLARGDRRGIVAVDVQGEIYALARWAGVKTKDLRAKCGDGEELEHVAAVQARLRQALTGQVKGFIQQFRDRQSREAAPLRAERDALVAGHRAERERLRDKQAERFARENRARMERLNKGLRGLWDRVTGRHGKVRDANLREALEATRRDRDQRDDLVLAQMRERQALQQRMIALRRKQAEERRIMARDVAGALRRQFSPGFERMPERHHRREHGFDLSR